MLHDLMDAYGSEAGPVLRLVGLYVLAYILARFYTPKYRAHALAFLIWFATLFFISTLKISTLANSDPLSLAQSQGLHLASDEQRWYVKESIYLYARMRTVVTRH